MDRDDLGGDIVRKLRIKFVPRIVERRTILAVRIRADLLDSVRAVSIDAYPKRGVLGARRAGALDRIQEPLTSDTESFAPVTAYPLQLELVALRPCRSRRIIGACCRGAMVGAGCRLSSSLPLAHAIHGTIIPTSTVPSNRLGPPLCFVTSPPSLLPCLRYSAALSTANRDVYHSLGAAAIGTPALLCGLPRP